MRRITTWIVAASAVVLMRPGAGAQTSADIDPSFFRELIWRSIGPFHGGTTVAAAGIPSQPDVFYIGAAGGGVWHTEDAGRTWTPLFDDQATAAIGAIAVAPSSPQILYIGTGAAIERADAPGGDGVYRSSDAGRTWTHLGLGDSRQIARIVVDPQDPNRLFVAALGHASGPNDERGVFRSLDGGRTWTKVLYRDADTGASDLAFDPGDPQVIYAVLWQAQLAPWADSRMTGSGSGLFKSTDGGTTWAPIMTGLPTFAADGLGQIRIAVAPSIARRLFAAVVARTRGGLYRSDDAGATWALVNGDARVMGSEAAADIEVDPRNPDLVFAAGTAAWKSADGGRSFALWREAPDRGRYHRLWINPREPRAMVLASDRGAVVTVNGGDTWSSENNQPTAQFFRTNTDAAFPYRVCGVEMTERAVCVASRGSFERISTRDVYPVGVVSQASVAADPLDPEVVYSGSVTRFDRRSGQVQDVSPARDAGFHTVSWAPLLFAPTEPHTLFFGANRLWKSVTGGQTWAAISPDLSRDHADVPAAVGASRSPALALPPRGGIDAVGLSSIDPNLIWAGTDDGLAHLTRDGGRTWLDVTPPQLVPWARVSSVEASHFDVNSAYVTVSTARLDQWHPAIYRTRDAGKSWTLIIRGLSESTSVNAVREDVIRRGLLFAATDHGVAVSFDDGERWQMLRRNMPATPVQDLTIKDDDLVAATNGRGFWILDDITPLRQLTSDVARADVFLFRPPTAWRVQPARNGGAESRDEPGAPNPPPGVTITYAIGANASGPVTLEILDTTSGTLLRRYSSEDAAPAQPAPSAGQAQSGPSAPAQSPAQSTMRLTASPGLHRFVWDVRLAPPDTSLSEGMWPLPGTYQVRLTVGSRVVRQAVIVKLDPRVKTPMADLTAQFTLSKSVNEALRRLAEAVQRLQAAGRAAAGDGAARFQPVLNGLSAASAQLADLFSRVQQADVHPTATLEAAVEQALAAADTALGAATDASN